MTRSEIRSVLGTALQTAWGVGYVFVGALPFYAAVSGLSVLIQYLWIAGLLVTPVAFGVGAVASYWTGPRRAFNRRIARGEGELMSQDDFGKLWRLGDVEGNEPIVVVEVVNMTPEPDGSYRRYLLRVPPEMTTPREGLAWSFKFDNPDDYILAVAS